MTMCFWSKYQLTFCFKIGGSAAAAGDLVKQLGGTLAGYLFIVEIPFLKGRDKLDNIPVVTLLDVNE